MNGTQIGISFMGLSKKVSSYFGISGVNVKVSDILSVAKGTLRSLKTDIEAALPAEQDRMTRYPLQDMIDRIDLILNPKGK